jgi:hypothetical protein
MASEEPQQTAAEDQPRPGSITGRFVKKLFAKRGDDPENEPQPAPPEEGIARVPATVLTVEYVDDSEGMDAAIKEMGENLRKVAELLTAMQETQGRLVAAVNQQAKDIGKVVESLGRRIDRIYRRVGEGGAAAGAEPVAEEEVEPTPAPEPPVAPSVYQGPVGGLSADVADDPAHQNAWRIARVLAADLEAYHEDAVREGVLYGTFYSVLREPMEKARKTYEQRVSKEIVEGYDYFSKALDELIVRKRMELEEEGSL